MVSFLGTAFPQKWECTVIYNSTQLPPRGWLDAKTFYLESF